MEREMKHSGIEWIGEIPKEWKESKTLYVLSMPITDGPHTTPDLFDNGIPFISADAVSDGFINFDNKRGFISKSFYEECCKKYIPQRDDIYMIKSGASTGQTAIVETDEIFTIWSPLAVFRANKDIMIPRFLLYVLRSEGYQKQVENNWSYGTQQNIGMRTLEGLIVSYPNIDEQQKIANYLDKACGEVDEMIALQEQMIDELKAYKQSVITEAATKGLNPKAPMKDSEIDWIGEVPEHWGKDKIVRIFNLVGSGTTPSSSDNEAYEGNLNWIQSGDINGGDLYESKTKISEKTLAKYSALTMYDAPFIIIAMYGASVGNISISHINGCVNQACCVMSKTKQDFKYVFYAIKSAKDYLIYKAVGGGQPNISQSTLKQLWLPVPPLSEQQSIASYLDTKCSEIDALIAIKQSKIEELKEYKKSIIYEYVTGKKEVE